MFKLREEHIDFISNDIRQRGIYLDALHDNLLDHVCCIIETEMKEEQDFQTFYSEVIHRFFQKELSEIEDETFLLITFKNHHIMKKITTLSGIVAAVFMCAGIFFKYMHWPGAGMFLVLGISITSLVFMPLLFIFRSKTSANSRDKLLLGSGVSLGIVLSLHILFKIMHWPGANILLNIINVALFIFIPVYFFTGYRNEQTRSNTVLMTVLMVLGLGLLFTLKRSPMSSRKLGAAESGMYLRSELMVQKQLIRLAQQEDKSSNAKLRAMLIQQCESVKAVLSEDVTESEFGPIIATGSAIDYANSNANVREQLDLIRENSKAYNADNQIGNSKLISTAQLEDIIRMESGLTLLNALNQMELQLIHDRQELVAEK